MRLIRIFFPKNLTTTSAVHFGEYLRALPIVEAYELNFGENRWIEPFAALVASSEITRLKHRVQQRPIKVLNQQHMTYAAHMGFFQSFGFQYGNAPGAASGGISYQPI